MKCKILHESNGRMRLHAEQTRMTLRQADILEAYLRQVPGVTEVKIYDRTCDAVVLYRGARTDLIRALAAFSYAASEALAPEHSSRALGREYEDKLVLAVCRHYFKKLFLPMPLRTVITLFRSVHYLRAGLSCLLHGKIQVPVLDATAIGVSMLRGDFATAGSIMFLLGIGDILDEWTHKKSVADLAQSMSLNVDKVWLQTPQGDVLVPLHDVQVGDRISVRTGGMIPLDGKVVSGEAMVNQASITGEPLAVRKSEGGYVYAGTVIEEGDCVVLVEKAAGSGRYDRIVHMIEESEKLKSDMEDHAAHLADRLVPYSLGATALIWLLTRNVTQALAVLMVDFSCALKLSMPIAVLSAMKEATGYHLSVKGGRFLEAVSEADTIVFDKTGTLTRAEPKVAQIVTFGENSEADMLRLAACLEEHYPHSMAKAVVAEAARRELHHEERHSRVEYIVAHGISSSVDGQKVVIGSHHFVFEDEHCSVPAGDEEKFASLPEQYSHLYLAVSGVLAAVICIPPSGGARRDPRPARAGRGSPGHDDGRQRKDRPGRGGRRRCRRLLRGRPARGQGELHPPRARCGPQGHHARRRRKRLARPLRGRRGHRHQRRRGHRARGRRHHAQRRGSLRAAHAQASERRAHGPDPRQLPQDHRL